MPTKRKSTAKSSTPAKKAKASAVPKDTTQARTQGLSRSTSSRAASVEDVPDEGETSNDELRADSSAEPEEPEEDPQAQPSK